MTLIEDISDHEEILDSMPVGVIGLAIDSDFEITESNYNWRENYPLWQHAGTMAREQLGDCFCIAMEYILTISQPYPGDDHWDKNYDCALDRRFRVNQSKRIPDILKIKDDLTGVKVEIHKFDLDNSKFNFSHWFAKKQCEILNLEPPISRGNYIRLEDPRILIARNLLFNSIHSHFPNVKPYTKSESRFLIHQKDFDSESHTYVIIDNDLDLTVEINKVLLENPKFNLIQWYLRYVMKDRNYYEKYIRYHKYLYHAIPKGHEDPYIDLPNLEFDEEDSEEENEFCEEIIKKVRDTLERCQPYPGDDTPIDSTYDINQNRFIIDQFNDIICVYDRVQGFEAYLSWNIFSWNEFSIAKWFVEQCITLQVNNAPWELIHLWMLRHNWHMTTMNVECNFYEKIENADDKDLINPNNDPDDDDSDSDPDDDTNNSQCTLLLNGLQVDKDKYVDIQ